MDAVRRIRFLVGATAAVTGLAGCGGGRLAVQSGDPDRGLVIVLPGIDGVTLHSLRLRRVLAEKAAGAAVELHDWTSPLGPLFNQTAEAHNRRVAGQLADRIRAYRRQHPTRPVHLVAHSGGTAIAVWALEDLGPSEAVDRVVLLGSSLSPLYSLSAALGRTRRGIVNYYSGRDSILLGAGTSLVGTMDGRHTEAAGKVGFRLGAAGVSAHRLVQVAWRPDMERVGNDGGHFGCTAKPFVAAHVAPLLAGTTVAASTDAPAGLAMMPR